MGGGKHQKWREKKKENNVFTDQLEKVKMITGIRDNNNIMSIVKMPVKRSSGWFTHVHISIRSRKLYKI